MAQAVKVIRGLPVRWRDNSGIHPKDFARRLKREVGPDAFFQQLNGAWWLCRWLTDADRYTRQDDGRVVETLPWKRRQEILCGPALQAGELFWYIARREKTFPRGKGPRPVFDAEGRWIGLTDWRGRAILPDGTVAPHALLLPH